SPSVSTTGGRVTARSIAAPTTPLATTRATSATSARVRVDDGPTAGALIVNADGDGALATPQSAGPADRATTRDSSPLQAMPRVRLAPSHRRDRGRSTARTSTSWPPAPPPVQAE